MKILHVASFSGNIGDNASHLGFRRILGDILPQFEITQLEIRKFYKNYRLQDKLEFDEVFLSLLKGYDMLIIGGGGFFDFWVPDSQTGTTIDISADILARINIPLIISSVGCMPHKQIPEGNLEKFKRFLDDLLGKKNTYIAVRNDGSINTIQEFVGTEYARAIPEVVDHGFFYENNGSFYLPFESPYIAINSTSDQLAMLNRKVGNINIELYKSELRKVIDFIITETDINLVFVPHIYSDIEAIYGILSGIDDFNIRTRIALAPFSNGNLACNQAFSAYKNSMLNIGMRFHANVCSIAMQKPTIGLAALDRVLSVFESMCLPDNAVKVDGQFSAQVIKKVQQGLENPSIATSSVLIEKKALTKSFYESVFARI